MKNLWTLFLIAMVMFFVSTSSNAGGRTIVDDVLMIPYATEAPTIDGDMDPIWYSVTATPLLLFEDGPADSVGSYPDHFSSFRTMWDEDNFYVYVQVVDDEISFNNRSEPWMNDCIELFFDGDNAKASEYDANDIQWRYVYGDVVGDTANISNGPGNFIFKATSVGYNLEVAIPIDSLEKLFPLELDQEIGFEVSNADRDNGTREEVLHWWTNDGQTWANPSLFGTALLSNREANSVLNVQYTSEAPTIDGEQEDSWDIADEISLTLFEDTDRPDTILTAWTDHLTSAKVMWDEDNFYAIVKVIDEEKNADNRSEPWMNDCIELFFDGDNAKASEYDGNDIQWRWVYGDTPGDTANISNGPGNFAFKDIEDGYVLEIAIPVDSLESLFPLVNDQEIGFEISNADRDNGSRNNVRHWWTSNGQTWANPSLFGTALLIGGPVSVEAKYLDKAADYTLEQNYPNPFNPTTKITYSIADNQSVRLTVYDVVGREVAVLINETQRAGKYSVELNAANLSSGVYFYELRTGNQLFVKKMMLLK